MLNSVEISGYKSLQRSKLVLEPFSVIVGRNNVGKSNFFDAVQLLSTVAQMPVASAFRPELHRGDPLESFFTEERQTFIFKGEFDLTGAPHPFRATSKLRNAVLSYEVEIHFQSGMLEVHREELRSVVSKGKVREYLHTENGEVCVNRDLVKGGKTRHFPVPAPRSVLTMIDDAELYPHIVALANELASWRFFHFEPEALREPSPAMDITELETNGRGLSGFYDTLRRHHPKRFERAEHALRRALPEIDKIDVLDTGDRRRLLRLCRKDGRDFTARVLSDGTLRFLALLAIAYAENPPGLVCFEEPENGVHPARLPFIVDILRGISERGSEGGPRSQVIVNTHSPYLVDLLEPEEALHAFLRSDGSTEFRPVSHDLFNNRKELREMLENGEKLLGELWAEGSFDVAL